MKYLKIIGLFTLFCISFIYTEKVINVSLNQDDIMIKLKEEVTKHNRNPIDAKIDDDMIIPGNKGLEVDIKASYNNMKKYGYYNDTLIKYKEIYPDKSIYNNYNLYIHKGNIYNKNVSIIYILNNNNLVDNILDINKLYNIPINIFIDSNYLNNNISIIDSLNYNEIYNYGNKGIYTKENLIITNNIINNKSNNKSIYCLFLEKDSKSLDNCVDNKMHSIYIDNISTLSSIKNNLANGEIFLINNTQELSLIIEYIQAKGYKIVPLSELIIE